MVKRTEQGAASKPPLYNFSAVCESALGRLWEAGTSFPGTCFSCILWTYIMSTYYFCNLKVSTTFKHRALALSQRQSHLLDLFCHRSRC